MVSSQHILTIIVKVRYFLATNAVILRGNVDNQCICRIEKICPLSQIIWVLLAESADKEELGEKC